MCWPCWVTLEPRQHPNTSRSRAICHPTEAAQSLPVPSIPLLHHSHFLLTLLISSISLAGLGGRCLVTTQSQKLISAKQFEIVQKTSKTPLLDQDLSLSKFGQVIRCGPSKGYIGCDFLPHPPKRTFFWLSVSFVRQGSLELWLSKSMGAIHNDGCPVTEIHI